MSRHWLARSRTQSRRAAPYRNSVPGLQTSSLLGTTSRASSQNTCDSTRNQRPTTPVGVRVIRMGPLILGISPRGADGQYVTVTAPQLSGVVPQASEGVSNPRGRGLE